MKAVNAFRENKQTQCNICKLSRNAFRAKSNICNGVFLQAVNYICKKAPWKIFDWSLNTSLLRLVFKTQSNT